jgi:hypothetical protein
MPIKIVNIGRINKYLFHFNQQIQRKGKNSLSFMANISYYAIPTENSTDHLPSFYIILPLLFTE